MARGAVRHVGSTEQSGAPCSSHCGGELWAVSHGTRLFHILLAQSSWQGICLPLELCKQTVKESMHPPILFRLFLSLLAQTLNSRQLPCYLRAGQGIANDLYKTVGFWTCHMSTERRFKLPQIHCCCSYLQSIFRSDNL